MSIIIYFGTGSSGNSTYYCDGTTSILIDNGVPLKYITEPINGGILLSHEHYDHHSSVIPYLKKYGSKYGISCIVDRSFYVKNIPESYLTKQDFMSGKPFLIKTIEVIPQGVFHDVPCFYFILNKEYLHITDTGVVPFTVAPNIRKYKIKVLYIESNYDEELLKTCDYDEIVKQRIRSKVGHLSNQKVISFLNDNKKSLKSLKYILLGHISENSNSEEHLIKLLSSELDKSILKKVHIVKKGSKFEL